MCEVLTVKARGGYLWSVSYFKGVPVGAEFMCNGNTWRKRSTRTAVMVKPEGPWFYFNKYEVVERKVA